MITPGCAPRRTELLSHRRQPSPWSHPSQDPGARGHRLGPQLLQKPDLDLQGRLRSPKGTRRSQTTGERLGPTAPGVLKVGRRRKAAVQLPRTPRPTQTGRVAPNRADPELSLEDRGAGGAGRGTGACLALASLTSWSACPTRGWPCRSPWPPGSSCDVGSSGPS